MEITARLRHLRMAPRKVRLVANLIKGMDINGAKAQLRFMPKKASGFLLKLLNSAVANAKHNFNLKEENLYISKILIDPGPSLKRWMPRAMGRATPILKRTCHIALILSERPLDFAPFGLAQGGRGKVEKEQISKESDVEHGKEKRIGESEKNIEKPIDLTRSKEIKEEKEIDKSKKISPAKPFGASGVAKKRFFSRQTFGNLKRGIKKLFRRKSV